MFNPTVKYANQLSQMYQVQKGYAEQQLELTSAGVGFMPILLG